MKIDISKIKRILVDSIIIGYCVVLLLAIIGWTFNISGSIFSGTAITNTITWFKGSIDTSWLLIGLFFFWLLKNNPR